MKWLRPLAFTLTLLFITGCATTVAHPATPVRRIPQSEFRPIPTYGAVPVATPSPTPASPSPRSTPRVKSITRASSPKGTGGKKTVLRGEASWGYGFRGHVVTRYRRGTTIRVCGKLGCTGKVRSWGYGPAKRTGRIADLDVGVFENVCGPRSMGTCNITLEVWK
jgi:hypothetical protein